MLKILSLALFAARADALKCVTCRETRDHDGNQIGNADEGCFDGDNLGQYEIDCPNDSYQYCGVEIIIDWMPRGYQQYSVRRNCLNYEAGPGCYSADLSGFAYKDCVETCQGDNCNSGNTVFEKATVRENGKPRELSCYSCSSDFDEQADTDNMPYCYSTPTDQPTGKECPIYANAGCFKSKAIYASENGDDDVAHFYKGCSSFAVKENVGEGEVECQRADAPDGGNVLFCDSICTGNNDQGTPPCNGGTPQGGGKMCFTCEASINQKGQMVGWGDPSCIDHPHNYQLELCADEQDACITEFSATWQLLGEQVYTMKRRCGRKLENGMTSDCIIAEGRNFKGKQCFESCVDKNIAGCNNGTEIFNQFRTGQMESCRTCTDHVYGNVVNKDCAKDPQTSRKCPPYADAACFSSRVVYDTSGNEESDTHHGCSTFKQPQFEADGGSQDQKICTQVTVEGQFNGVAEKKTSCKETCLDNDCNDSVTEITDNVSQHFCAACTVTVDHFNNTIGEGDSRCFQEDIPNFFTVPCAEGENFCITDLEVDWMPNGDQYTTIRRGCAAQPAPENCVSGQIQTWQYKDCSTTCTDNLLSACNTGIYETAQLFHQQGRPQDSCFNCESHHYPHEHDCGDNFSGPEAIRNIVKCPIYAQEGCFTSINRLKEYNLSTDDIIRGCSTFEQPYACSGWSERYIKDGVEYPYEWTACKESCKGTNCNNQEAKVADDNRCYVCTAQRDSRGGHVGLGWGLCFNEDLSSVENAASLEFECGKDEHCITDMEVDWMPHGDQITTIRRRCGKQELTPGCETLKTNSFAKKECSVSCQGALCNSNMDPVRKLFEPKANEPKVDECYSCSYNELTGHNPVNPFHEDITHCKDGPGELSLKTCPSWASSACFTADVVVQDKEIDDEDIVNIFRGCSSLGPDLVTDELFCATITVDVDVDSDVVRHSASACKQICTGDKCNDKEYPEFKPPELPEDCPPCDQPTDQPTTVQPTTTTSTTTTTANANIANLSIMIFVPVLTLLQLVQG